jgi:biopolymer transport protein ExbD
MKTTNLSILLLAINVLIIGCTTQRIMDKTAPAAEINIDGTVSVNGRTVPVEQLPATLRSLGFTPEDTIKIKVRDQNPTPAMKTVASVLKSAGFGRIMFVTTRHATATVREKTDNQSQTK